MGDSNNDRSRLRYMTPGCKSNDILKPGEETNDNEIIVKSKIMYK